jgi:hypothetical protein
MPGMPPDQIGLLLTLGVAAVFLAVVTGIAFWLRR